MEERIKRIKNIYNDCAKNFNQYLADYNLAAYQKRAEALIEKYGRKVDVVDLVMWFAVRVQGLHDERRKKNVSN